MKQTQAAPHILALPPAVPAAPAQAEELGKVRQALLHGQLKEASVEIEAFHREHPESADGLYLLGEVKERQNSPGEALEIFTRAAALRPPTAEQLRLAGLAYVLLADYVDATHWLEQAVQLSPDDAESWYALGRVKYTTGDFHAAELDFLRSLSTVPGSVKTQNNLGLAYAAQNRPQEALIAYREAVRLQREALQKSEQPLLNYGMLLLHLGNKQAAIEALTQAVAVAPSDATCHEALGRALLQADEVESSVQHLQAAVGLEPANPRFHFELGRAYKKAGREAQAHAEFMRSEQLYGTSSTPAN